MKEVKEIINTTLDDEQKKLAYQLSDGTRGSQQICKATGIKSPTTVTKHWKTWIRLGLGEAVAVSGGDRFKRAFDLEDFGYEIEIPTSDHNAESSDSPKQSPSDQETLQAPDDSKERPA